MTPLSGPTPMTDAAEWGDYGGPVVVNVDFARNLERLLAEAVGALDEATTLLKEFYGKDNHGHLSASTTRLFERTGRWLHGDPPGASPDAALSGEGETT